MIRFCDKEVFSITIDDFKRMNASQLLEHFVLNDGEYKYSAIFLYNNSGQYYGMITYDSLCSDNEVIIRDCFVITEAFWGEARKYFAEKPNAEIPVFDRNKQVLGFCYYDKREYGQIRRPLEGFEVFHQELLSPLTDLHKDIKLICINDLNEYAWRLYWLFKKYEYPVCVLGEQWEWFGIKTMEGYETCPSYAKMYIYAEGREYFRGRGMRDSVNVNKEFFFLRTWLNNNKRILYGYIIDELLKKGISVCKVTIPNMGLVNRESFTKEELINQLASFSTVKLSNDKNIRERQRSYLGETEYLEKEKRDRVNLNDYGWETVLFSGLQGERLIGVSFTKRIYLVGPCIVSSMDSLTENTLVACLQKLVNDYGYEVIKVLCQAWSLDKVYEIGNIPIKEEDIVIIIDQENLLDLNKNSYKIDLLPLYNKPREDTWFKDKDARHVNSAGNKAIAQEIFDKCVEGGIFTEGYEAENNLYLQKGEILSPELQQPIYTYVDSLKQYSCQILGRGQLLDDTNVSTKTPKIGSIVMNCNPFTKGHQYLIGQAASQVDYLYIFVVQEDKSFFTFEDRFELVKAGTAHLNNVIVVPSGEHVLSYKTLPVYFEKEEQKTAKVDATQDVEIFARYIAPRLGITCRFAGEEPIDMITKQYNEQMADILPQFDIEFIEIPRKVTASDNEVISASRVRKLMKEDKWEEIRELVPETTYDYLLKKYANRDTLL